MITYDDFAKLEIRIGKIAACEKVENADKLLKLTVDFGADDRVSEGARLRSEAETRMEQSLNDSHPHPLPEGEGNMRTIVSGIAEWYKPEDLVGKLCPFLVNLEPRKLRGIESQGMILAADPDGSAVLLHPDKEIPAGSKIR